VKRVTQRRSSITAAPRLSGPPIRTRLSLGTPLGLLRDRPEVGRYPRPARYSLRAACTTSTSLGGMSWSRSYASNALSISSAMVTDVRFMASMLVGAQERLRVLSIRSRSTVLHAAELAPERQAFARATAWSMSTSEESVNVCPVYGSTYVPAVMEQSSSIWTPLPSHPEGFPERTDSQVAHLALQQPQ
jgi:hypothetical protein